MVGFFFLVIVEGLSFGFEVLSSESGFECPKKLFDQLKPSSFSLSSRLLRVSETLCCCLSNVFGGALLLLS